MSYFYSSPTSNILLQPHPGPSAIRMTRTGSSSSTTSTSSSSSSISISPSYNTSRPGSSSASFSSSYWSSSSSNSSPSSSYTDHSHGHSRHNNNGTSYLPTPFRSSLLNSASSSSSTPSAPSSYFSDDELLSLCLEPMSLTGSANATREMTTEEQVAAVREQLGREREEGLKPEAWWQHQQEQAPVPEKRSRVVRFAGEARPSATSRRSSGQKRRSAVVGAGSKASSGRRD